MASTDTRDTKARLVVEGELTIYHAAEWKPRILGALAGAGTLEIDLSGVDEIDSAGIQLLLLAKRSAQATGATLQLSGHSRAVLEAFELFDLGAYFGDALVIT